MTVLPASSSPQLRHVPSADTVPPPDRSSTLRASVLETALALGVGHNALVTNWMFNEGVINEDDEEDEQPLTPDLTHSTTTSSSSHSHSHYQYPSYPLPKSGPGAYFPTPGLASPNHDPDTALLLYASAPGTPVPTTPSKHRKLRKAAPYKGTEGWESDGGYVSEAATAKNPTGKKAEEKRARTELKRLDKERREKEKAEEKERKAQEKKERKARRKTRGAETAGGETDYDSDGGYLSEVSRKSPRKPRPTPPLPTPSASGYETDGGTPSKKKLGFFRKTSKQHLASSTSHEDLRSASSQRAKEPVPAMPPMPMPLPIASRFARPSDDSSLNLSLYAPSPSSPYTPSASASGTGSSTPSTHTLEARSVTPVSAIHTPSLSQGQESKSGMGSNPSFTPSSTSSPSLSSSKSKSSWSDRDTTFSPLPNPKRTSIGNNNNNNNNNNKRSSAQSVRGVPISLPLTASSPSTSTPFERTLSPKTSLPSIRPNPTPTPAKPTRSESAKARPVPLNLARGADAPIQFPPSPAAAAGVPALMVSSSPGAMTRVRRISRSASAGNVSPLSSNYSVVPSSEYILGGEVGVVEGGGERGGAGEGGSKPMISPRSVLAYYDIPPPSPPPSGPLPSPPRSTPSSSRPQASPLSAPNSRSTLSPSNSNSTPSPSPRSASPIRGRTSPFPSAPKPSSSASGSGPGTGIGKSVGIGGPMDGFEARMKVRRYRDLYGFGGVGVFGGEEGGKSVIGAGGLSASRLPAPGRSNSLGDEGVGDVGAGGGSRFREELESLPRGSMSVSASEEGEGEGGGEGGEEWYVVDEEGRQYDFRPSISSSSDGGHLEYSLTPQSHLRPRKDSFPTSTFPSSLTSTLRDRDTSRDRETKYRDTKYSMMSIYSRSSMLGEDESGETRARFLERVQDMYRKGEVEVVPPVPALPARWGSGLRSA